MQITANYPLALNLMVIEYSYYIAVKFVCLCLIPGVF